MHGDHDMIWFDSCTDAVKSPHKNEQMTMITAERRVFIRASEKYTPLGMENGDRKTRRVGR